MMTTTTKNYNQLGHSAGTFRMRKAGIAAGQASGINEYLHSLIDPFGAPEAVMPDLDMTTSIPKSVRLTASLVNKGDLLIVASFHADNQAFRVYGWDPNVSRFNFLRSLPPDEDISLDFSRARFISGGLKARSATTSGGAFSVSGQASASSYQDAPEFRTLTVSKISAFKRNAIDVVTSVPVQSGVALIAHPDGDSEFRPRETNAVFNRETDLALYGGALNGEPLPPFVNSNLPALLIPAGSKWFDTDLVPDAFLPPNAFGKQRVVARMTIAYDETAVQPIEAVRFHLYTYHATASDAVGYPETIVKKLRSTWYGYAHLLQTIDFNVMFEDEAELVRITIENDTNMDHAIIKDMDGLTIGTEYLEYQNYSRECEGTTGPGCVLGITGMGEDQQLSLAGILNYEAVPDSDLSRNISTSYSEPHASPTDIRAAEAVMANAGSVGLRFVYNLLDYESASITGKFREVAMRENNYAFAAGFFDSLGDFAGKVWEVAKPLARNAAPLIGNTITSATANPLLGGLATRVLTDGFAASGQHASKVGYAAGRHVKVPVRQKHEATVPSTRPTTPGSACPGASAPVACCRDPRQTTLQVESANEEYRRALAHIREHVDSVLGGPKRVGHASGRMFNPRVKHAVRRMTDDEVALTSGSLLDPGSIIKPVLSSVDSALTSKLQRLTSPALFGRHPELTFARFPLIDSNGEPLVTATLVGSNKAFAGKDYVVLDVLTVDGDSTVVKLWVDTLIQGDDALHQLAMAARATSLQLDRPMYITVLTNVEAVVGSSLGLAAYSVMASLPSSCVVSGALFELEGGEMEHNIGVAPIAYGRAKLALAQVAGYPLITPFDSEIMEVDGLNVMTPNNIAAGALGNVNLNAAVDVFLVDSLASYSLATIQAASATREKHRINAPAPQPSKAVKGDPNEPYTVSGVTMTLDEVMELIVDPVLLPGVSSSLIEKAIEAQNRSRITAWAVQALLRKQALDRKAANIAKAPPPKVKGPKKTTVDRVADRMKQLREAKVTRSKEVDPLGDE